MSRTRLLSFLSILSFLSFFNSVAAQDKIVVDAQAQIREISGNFRELNVSGGVMVYLVKADQPALAVSARDQESLITTMENGVLTIRNKTRLRNNHATAYLALPSLETVNLSGVSELRMEGKFSAPKLSFNLSGASEMRGDVETDELSIMLSGSSDALMKGSAKNLTIVSSGASDFNGNELKTETAKVNASGASDANLYVTADLNVQASGASDIVYRGGAHVSNKALSGSSSLSGKQ